MFLSAGNVNDIRVAPNLLEGLSFFCSTIANVAVLVFPARRRINDLGRQTESNIKNVTWQNAFFNG